MNTATNTVATVGPVDKWGKPFSFWTRPYSSFPSAQKNMSFFQAQHPGKMVHIVRFGSGWSLAVK